MKKTNKKGFTMIEIIAAVTILGILSVIGIVNVCNGVTKELPYISKYYFIIYKINFI